MDKYRKVMKPKEGPAMFDSPSSFGHSPIKKGWDGLALLCCGPMQYSQNIIYSELGVKVFSNPTVFWSHSKCSP